MLRRSGFLIVLIYCVVSEKAEGLQSGPCAIEDFKCVSEATESFREKLAYGNAAFDIKPYDPFIIDVVNSNLIDGTLAQFKNINVTGLRKQKITELKYDRPTKSVEFACTIDVNVASDIDVEYEETKKKYSGTYIASGKAAITAKYDYQLKTDDKGMEHLVSGPEILTCNFMDFHIELNKELTTALENDSHANKIYQDNLTNMDTIKKKNVCNILKIAYAAVMEATRKIERVYPANVFFTNA